MFRFSQWSLLSAVWRPHSEQIKYWLADPDRKGDTLPLARNYVHELDLSGALVTLDDGIELIDLLRRLSYPRGSHAVLHLATHIGSTSKELDPSGIRALAANAKLANGRLDYYDATLSDSAFVEAFTRCLREMKVADLVQCMLVFAARNENGKREGLAPVSARLSQLAASEIESRLHCTGDKADVLFLLTANNVPFEEKQYAGLMTQVLSATRGLKPPMLLRLLRSIKTECSFGTHPEWCAVIQDTLVAHDALSQNETVSAVIDIVGSGCSLTSSFASRVADLIPQLTRHEILSVLSACREAEFAGADRLALRAVGVARIEETVERGLQQQRSSTGCSREFLEWLVCLAYLSVEKSTGALTSLVAAVHHSLTLSAQEAALLAKAMILSECFPKPLVREVCRHGACDALDQIHSVAIFFVCQKDGRGVSPALQKRAVGRLGMRLVTTSSHSSKASSPLPCESTALLATSLCFTDSKEHMGILDRLLQSAQMTPSVSMFVLQHTLGLPTQAAVHARTRLMGTIVRGASTYTAKELAHLVTSLADLKIRDLSVFEQLLRAMQCKSPGVAEVAMAAKAATALELSSVFERSPMVSSALSSPTATPADLLTVLRGCGTERRQALLSSTAAQALISRLVPTSLSTPELLALVMIFPAKSEQRQKALAVLKSRPAAGRGELGPEAVISALEGAEVAEELDCVCKVCASTAQDLTEAHLLRLLRCAESSPSVPRSFFRFAGKAILTLHSRNRLSPHAALLWLEYYVSHEVQDPGVGRCLVSHARKSKTAQTSQINKTILKAGKLYGIESATAGGGLKRRPKKVRAISHEYV